jgi:RsiW-degrading membrane proteinase PrsW (M82 family)
MLDLAVKFSISIFPVFIFLITLVFLDTYKLVKLPSILRTILIGCITAILCFWVNNWLLTLTKSKILLYSRYIAPFIEESFKAVFIVFLLRRKKIGFLVDAAIYGFAIGAGFATIENFYFVNALARSNLLLWVIRGFGTAVMHGATTAIFAILSVNFLNRHPKQKIISFLPGILIAFGLHSLFNHFILPPVIMTLLQLIILPLLMALAFTRSEKALQEWMEAGMDVDVWLLDYINTGRVFQTKIGEYLTSLKNQFSGEVVADMLCYVRLHLELAIRVKGILMLRETGLPPPRDPEIKEKLEELKYLEKSIGKTGKLALSPILHTSSQELWQLELVDT